MADYPTALGDRVVGAEALEGVVGRIFAACGMSAADAGLLALTLVRADLRGIHSHGVLRVPDYVAKLTRDGVDPRGRPEVVRDDGGALVVDGRNSMGQIGGVFAMEKAIARARTTRLAATALRGSNHCGAMDHYAMMALEADMIGIATTNALPTMAPWGGADKIVGINPLAVAIPAQEADPIVLDIAFGMTAHGKIRVHHQQGAQIPEDWAFDADGRPTTDAARALDGLIRPIGGHKGIGLAMVMGILASVLSGAGYGTESGNMVDGAKAGADGQLFIAIDIAGFEDPGRFKARVDGIVREVHESRRAPGVPRLLVPGEMEWELERRHRADGIPLAGATLDGIRDAARALGVDAGALAASPGQG
jgi:LDH2 family malate/lactate/ureidoglycolate dehydrogenase